MDSQEQKVQKTLHAMTLNSCEEKKRKLCFTFTKLAHELTENTGRYKELIFWQKVREKQLKDLCDRELNDDDKPNLTLLQSSEIAFPNNLLNIQEVVKDGPLIVSLFNQNKNFFLMAALEKIRIAALEAALKNNGIPIPEEMVPYPDPNHEIV